MVDVNLGHYFPEGHKRNENLFSSGEEGVQGEEHLNDFILRRKKAERMGKE